MIPVGRRGTTAFGSRSSWVQAAQADGDLDLMLSPRLRHLRDYEDLEEFMLLALIRYHSPIGVPTLKMVNSLARSLWDLRNCSAALLRLADESGAVAVTRRGRETASPRLQLQGAQTLQGDRLSADACREAEDQFCEFLAKAGTGSSFFSLTSLECSFHTFAWQGQGQLAVAHYLTRRLHRDRYCLEVTDTGRCGLRLSFDASTVRIWFERNETSRACEPSIVDPTVGSRRYQDSVLKYGVAFPVHLCGNYPYCEEGSACRLAHCRSLLSDGYTLGLSGCECDVQPGVLLEVFEAAMSQGRLCVPKSELLQKLRERDGAKSLGDIEESITELVRSGKLTSLTIAKTASLAQSSAVCGDEEGRMELLSVRLGSANSWLLGCLTTYLRRERLAASSTTLRKVALHFFGVSVPWSKWLDLARQNRDRFQVDQRGWSGTNFITERSGEKRKRYPVRAAPRHDVAARKRDMETFLISFQSDARDRCALESARHFGPESLRGNRLRALWDLHRHCARGVGPLAGDSAREDSGSDAEGGPGSPGGDPDIGLFLEQVFPPPPQHQPDKPLSDRLSDFVERQFEKARSARRGEKKPRGRKVRVELPPRFWTPTKVATKLSHELPVAVSSERAGLLLAACGLTAELFPRAHVPRGLVVTRIVAAMLKPHEDEHAGFADAILRAHAIARGDGAHKRLRRQLMGRLRRHEGLRGYLKDCKVAGSMQYGLDVAGSDHDLHIEVIDGHEEMAERLCNAMKELQSERPDFPLFANATLHCFEYGVSVAGYPLGVEWDVVPVTARAEFGGDLCQYDPSRRAWKPMLSAHLVPQLQSWADDRTDFFLAAKLMKMWNSRLPALRHKRTPSGRSEAAKPLSSFHVLLLAVAAWRQGLCDAGELTVPEALLSLLRFARQHWRNATLETGVPTAENHVRSIVAGYDLRLSPQLAGVDEHFRCAEEALRRMMATEDEVEALELADELFGPMGPGDAKGAAVLQSV